MKLIAALFIVVLSMAALGQDQPRRDQGKGHGYAYGYYGRRPLMIRHHRHHHMTWHHHMVRHPMERRGDHH